MPRRSASLRTRLCIVTAPTVVALLATAGTVIALAGPAGAQNPATLSPQLPDLTQDLPRQISVKTERRNGRSVHRLVFRSGTENHPDESAGGGALVLRGRRASRDAKTMVVDQHVDLFDPQTGRIDAQEVHRNVGKMRFVVSETHKHWHFLAFERYELRRASDNRLVAPDRKTGFCVGNRYAAAARAVDPPVGTPRRGTAISSSRVTSKEFNDNCGEDKPGLLSLTTGLNPKIGDDYKPFIEGQYIDVTSVPTGRYVLVHRANPGRTLVESNYTNNASSVLLQVTRSRGGKPTVRIVAKCAGRERCTPARK